MAEIKFGPLIRSVIFFPYVAVLYGSENKRLHGFIYTLQSSSKKNTSYGIFCWAIARSRMNTGIALMS